jgi:hypothetical protein
VSRAVKQFLDFSRIVFALKINSKKTLLSVWAEPEGPTHLRSALARPPSPFGLTTSPPWTRRRSWFPWRARQGNPAPCPIKAVRPSRPRALARRPAPQPALCRRQATRAGAASLPSAVLDSSSWSPIGGKRAPRGAPQRRAASLPSIPVASRSPERRRAGRHCHRRP